MNISKRVSSIIARLDHFFLVTGHVTHSVRDGRQRKQLVTSRSNVSIQGRRQTINCAPGCSLIESGACDFIPLRQMAIHVRDTIHSYIFQLRCYGYAFTFLVIDKILIICNDIFANSYYNLRLKKKIFVISIT